MKSSLIIALVFVLMVSACAVPTPYRPATNGEGYGEQQLEDDRYRVWFAGNAVTPRQTVEDYLLYRAAEITLQSGHAWFRVVRQDTETDTRYWTSGHAFPRFGDASFPYRHRTFGTMSYDAVSRPVTRYQAHAVILVYAGDRPAGDEHAYDAAQVIEALRETIVWPNTAG